jgi:glycosyltransferase involved in cell wall biosynthesis
VHHDLRVGAARVERIQMAVDLTLAERVRRRRAQGAVVDDRLLYIGLHKPHKNLARALEAFAASRLARSGGSFHLVGAAEHEIGDLRRLAASVPAAVVHEQCTDDELVEHYAMAGAVIQPSFEEGFGLTVVEALIGRVPVCCSTGGALEEAAAGCAELFDPRSVPSITAAIDRTVTADDWAERFDRFRTARPLLSPGEFAAQIVAAMDVARR